MCLYLFLLYVREIWAHIDIFESTNQSFKIVAPAVSSILRAKILKLNSLPVYLIKLIFCPKLIVFFSSICAWNVSSFGHILVPNMKVKCPKSPILAAFVPNHTSAQSAFKKKSKWLLGWNNQRRDAGWKFEMWGGHSDQNSEKHLKIYEFVKNQNVLINI